jgi:hypothetical protein
MATKAVRFSDTEEKAIKEFLKRNPYFDFSTLARMAIISFIENPNLKLKPSQLDPRNEQELEQ